ncbi:unnamed protein product [Rotaria magnacalcarata]|uniref:Ubiquitin-like domain-containing protein n=2 Tax=Rotaria magnacalcarata TaxID=392030 RepID=A0A816ZSQ6_9BILA|nr:unnamed protein product [Rotaria magnacalcarata]
MDVFMMIRRQKLTLFVDAKETSSVMEVKKIIEGITKVPTTNMRLIVDATKQPMDDDNQVLSDCGLSSAVAKAYSPALLYLCYRKTGNENEWEPIDVTELSTPPPLPEVLNKSDEDKKDNTQIAS